MSTNDMPDMTPPEPEAEPVANPWDSWQQAGFEPSEYNPHEVRQAADFFNALKNPDQRGHALSYFMSQLRDDERQNLFAGSQPPADDDDYYEGQDDEEYGYDSPGGIDPQAVEQIVNQRLAAFQQEQTQQRQQEQVQNEFERELLRATSDGYDDSERMWIASSALNLRQTDPYSTTAQVVDKAKAQYDKVVERRLQSAGQRQQEVNSEAVVPPGAVPSGNQIPRSPEEAMEQYLRRAQG